MINGAHIIVYTRDAVSDREFIRDVLEFPYVDAGDGWLIFALPPAEVAFHPAEENGDHQLFLMCDNLQLTMIELEDRGVKFEEPSDAGWGIQTEFQLPGGGRIGLYQPKHPVAAASESGGKLA